tara:strand:+ start:13582 stop:15570 length:1989 start_codon:yes stop_codon:yes gene_type:complete
MTENQDMKKIDGGTMDITAHNIEQIQQLFPNVVSEGKVDFDALKVELGESVDKESERYQFAWNGKEQAKRIVSTPSLGTLRPCSEESVDWGNTENLFIEGDNLEVLKLLQKSYFGKVKMIYIDPPYNTGKDFVYKDDFKDNIANYKRLTGQVDEEGNPLITNPDGSGRYHSNWLNMIYPRLKLARNLLTDDGAIFISIDDNEVHNLRKCCDEIFGGDNFIAMLSVENNPKGRKNSRYISVSNDYCLIYAKQKEIGRFVENIPKNIADMKQDEEGKYVHASGKRVLVGENDFNEKIKNTSSEKHYSVYYDHKNKKITLIQESSVSGANAILVDSGHNRYFSHSGGEFVENTYTKSKFLELFEQGALEFTENKIFEKNFNSSIRMKSLLSNKSYKALIGGKAVDYKIDVKTTSSGRYLKELFDTKDPIFSAPKSVGLVELFIKLFDDSNFIVLDFFCGSATTAHAVMAINSEDRGNRKSISVQIPEPTPEKSEARKVGYGTIAEISKERIRRSANKIKEEHPDTRADLGFKVFKLDTSNLAKWTPSPETIEQDILKAVNNIVDGRRSEDILYEVLIKYGLPLTYPVESITLNNQHVWVVAGGALIACFDEGITLDTVKEIAALKTDDVSVMRVVFRDTSFIDDAVKTNAIQHLKQYGIDDVLSI